MPKIIDVVLASLIEKSISSDDFKLTNSDATSREILYKTENLTPPELVKEFEREFSAYFDTALGEAMEISPHAVFFKKEENNKTEVESILKEHSYCTKK